MLRQIHWLLLLILFSFVRKSIEVDSCDSYNHYQYGFGECIEKTSCPYSLYKPGLCETRPIGFECCFSSKPKREEFRAVWIATVNNIDWPSSRFISPLEQQAELIKILNLVESLNMNGVIFQIRPTGDAFYESNLEPWSIYLTGNHGQAPLPFWDPLKFIIYEAHKRGIEVHAWLNPYRARMRGATYELAPNHMAKRFPEYAYQYADYIWMDPGSKEVVSFTLNVTEDIIRRYNVDAIHIDDYFYPYSDGTEFPDSKTYSMYKTQGGQLNISDWRRENVNHMVRSMYQRIHATRSSVKFGISPFGIWKSGVPAGISGFSSYDGLFCDSRLWLQEGWVDYMAPQLYWATNSVAQSYPVLLNWWTQQSIKGRHIYPGNAAYKMNDGSNQWPASEIALQVNITRFVPDQLALGNIFFSTSQIMNNLKGIQTELSSLYQNKAIIPRMPWL